MFPFVIEYTFGKSLNDEILPFLFSYPDPVMLQIHELSKPLDGCKHFREVKSNFPKNERELQARPPGMHIKIIMH